MTLRWPLRGKQGNILEASTRIEKKLKTNVGAGAKGLLDGIRLTLRLFLIV
jgi:hypothetical protein